MSQEDSTEMTFERWTQPKPQAPDFRIVRHTIQITKSGVDRLSAIAPKLAETQRVVLWWDESVRAIAITPTDEAADSVTVKTKNGFLSISAKGFFEFAGLSAGFTPRTTLLEPHNDGVKFFAGGIGRAGTPPQGAAVKKTREVKLDAAGNPVKRKYTRRNQTG